jgi:hypothetical protein
MAIEKMEWLGKAVMTAEELMQLSPEVLREMRAKERPHPCVQFDRRNLVLKVYEPPPYDKVWYEIDLERCNDPAQILDWIYQLNGKSWMTNDLMGQVIEAIEAACDEVFGHGIQGVFCPCGASRRADWRKVKGIRRGLL